jgi:trehalose-6-phosphate synthase
VISLELLGNYLLFLRKSLPSQVNPSVSVAQPQPSLSSEPVLTQKPTDTEILQLIQQLNKKLGTDNYLPIFHLRQKLQPPLSRDDLDQALYRLQREDKIELSSLVEAMHYTSEQLQAGIPQEIGGSLFFIIVN